VARQAYHMLIDCQNESPHKSLRIRALRSSSQSEPRTGTKNNFHSACRVYLILRLLPLLSIPLRHLQRNLAQIHKNKGLIVVVCCCVSVSKFRSNGMEVLEVTKTES